MGKDPGYGRTVRASLGRLARAGLAILIVLVGSAVAMSEAPRARPSAGEKRAQTERLLRAVEANPSVIKKSWFLREASAVNLILPITIRLLPARDSVPHFLSNDTVGNYATLDLGPSLGLRAIGLGGEVNGTVQFHTAFDSGRPGDVDIQLLADDATVKSTSIGLLTNPDVSTQGLGRDHTDVLDLAGASSGTFDLSWTSPSNVQYTASGLSPSGLTQVSLTSALQAVLGANNVFATNDGAGRFRITFAGKYSEPAGGLPSLEVVNNQTGSPVRVDAAIAGNGGGGGCNGFAGGNTADVDALENMQASLDPAPD